MALNQYLAILILSACPLLVAANVVNPTLFRQTTHWSVGRNIVSLRIAQSGEVFIGTKSGAILWCASIDSTIGQCVVAFDFGSTVHTWGDRGMDSLAIHPDWPNTNMVFAFMSVNHIADTSAPWPSTTCPNTERCAITGRLYRVSIDRTSHRGAIDQLLVSDWCAEGPGHHTGDMVWNMEKTGLFLSAGDGATGEVDLGLRSSQCYSGTGDQGALRAQRDEFLNGKVILMTMAQLMGRQTVPRTSLRIVAKGFRNPFRMTVHPETGDLFVADVGSNYFEELNVVPNPTSSITSIPNYGWPCFEGRLPQPDYAARHLSICVELASRRTSIEPLFTYGRSADIPSDESDRHHCRSAGGSITALLFHSGRSLGGNFRYSLFWADSSKGCVFYFEVDQSGNPNINRLHTLMYKGANSRGMFVDMAEIPSGNLAIVEYDVSQVHIVEGTSSGDSAPLAVARADPATSSSSEADVVLSGTESIDYDSGDSIVSYEWDFNSDGNYDIAGSLADAGNVKHKFTSGTHKVTLRVTDRTGKSSVDVVTIIVGVAVKVFVESSPSSGKWSLHNRITFRAKATTESGQQVPDELISWMVNLLHCDVSKCGTRVDCHSHSVELEESSSRGKEGTFLPLAHEMPHYWNITATVKHPFADFTSKQTVATRPRVYNFVAETTPDGLPIDMCSDSPCYRDVMAGMKGEIIAPPVTSLGAKLYRFVRWNLNDDNIPNPLVILAYQDVIVRAIFEEILPIESADIPVPTDVQMTSQLGQVQISWRVADATAWNFLVYVQLEGDGIENVFVSPASALTIVVPVPIVNMLASARVAVLHSNLQRGRRSPIASIRTKDTLDAGSTALCVQCFDSTLMIANFESGGAHANKIGWSNEIKQTKSVTINVDQGCMSLAPLNLRYTALLVDFGSQQSGKVTISIEIEGRYSACDAETTGPLVAHAKDIDSEVVGRVFSLSRLPLEGFGLRSLSSIKVSNKGSIDAAIDNIRLVRVCSELSSQSNLDFDADCSFSVATFDNSNSGNTLVPNPRRDSGFTSILMQSVETSRISNGMLIANVGIDSVITFELAPFGFCFDLARHKIGHISFRIKGFHRAMKVRLVRATDDCVRPARDEAIEVDVYDWGGFSSSDTHEVIIPLHAFDLPDARHIYAIEFMEFRSDDDEFSIDDVKLLQRCSSKLPRRAPTHCMLLIDDFADHSRFEAGANAFGGMVAMSINGSSATPTPGTVSVQGRGGLNTFTTTLFNKWTGLCIDIGFYDTLRFQIDQATSTATSFEIRLSFRESDCAGSSNELKLSSAVKVDQIQSATMTWPLASFDVALNNIHGIEVFNFDGIISFKEIALIRMYCKRRFERSSIPWWIIVTSTTGAALGFAGILYCGTKKAVESRMKKRLDLMKRTAVVEEEVSVKPTPPSIVDDSAMHSVDFLATLSSPLTLNESTLRHRAFLRRMNEPQSIENHATYLHSPHSSDSTDDAELETFVEGKSHLRKATSLFLRQDSASEVTQVDEVSIVSSDSDNDSEKHK